MPTAHPATATREDILKRARAGEITPQQAEEWAVENNQLPFASRPDIMLFDPLREPYWTLAMAAAWIIWRTPEKAREYWDDWRMNSLEWRSLPFAEDAPELSNRYCYELWPRVWTHKKVGLNSEL